MDRISVSLKTLLANNKFPICRCDNRFSVTSADLRSHLVAESSTLINQAAHERPCHRRRNHDARQFRDRRIRFRSRIRLSSGKIVRNYFHLIAKVHTPTQKPVAGENGKEKFALNEMRDSLPFSVASRQRSEGKNIGERVIERRVFGLRNLLFGQWRTVSSNGITK